MAQRKQRREGGGARKNGARKSVGRNYWMFVVTPENYALIRESGTSLFWMGRKFKRRAERMAPSDKALFYVSGIRKWPAIATITSTYFVDESPPLDSAIPGGEHPYRVSLKPDIELDEPDYIDALLLAPRLDYLRRWAPEYWPLAFHDRLHLLPQKDFRLIEGEMRRVVDRGG